MPLDPDLKVLLDTATGTPPLHTVGVAKTRAMYEGRPRPLAPAVGAVAERTVPGLGGALRLRVYAPNGAGPHPMLEFFRGGGSVLCSLDTHHGMCRRLGAGVGWVVVSVDSRLTLNAPFPAATEDCLAAFRWAAARTAELDELPACVVVDSDSAGVNLAAVTAPRMRDKDGPPLAGQTLLYPVTGDHTLGTESHHRNAEGYGLTAARTAWSWNHYPLPGADTSHPHATLLHAPVLAGLPPALAFPAEFDPMRQKENAYARHFAGARVPVVHKYWPGMNHGVLGLAG